MTMTLAFTIPEGVAWGDYFAEPCAPVQIEDTEEGWETSGAKKVTITVAPSARPARWCKHGNACLWQNCPFRHERCAHYDNWIARGKKGYTCRSCVADPESCKSPEEGGCKYDHRDLRKLAMYQHDIPCETLEQMWENFSTLGLEAYASDAFGISKMSRTDKALLFRSLKSYDIDFEDNETWIDVCFP